MKRIYQNPEISIVALHSASMLLSSIISVGGYTDDTEPNESRRFLNNFSDDDDE